MTSAAARGYSSSVEIHYSRRRIERDDLKAREKDLDGKAYQFDLNDPEQRQEAKDFERDISAARYIYSVCRVGRVLIFWASRPTIKTGINPFPLLRIVPKSNQHQR